MKSAEHRSKWVAALTAGALFVVGMAVLIGSAVAQERTGNPAKWRNYWTELYTVFTHPRCRNCHGATDPASGENHGGGPLDDPEDDHSCVSCHTANTTLVRECIHRDSANPSWITVTENVEREVCLRGGGEPREYRQREGETWNGVGEPPSFVGLDMRSLCIAVKKRKNPEDLLAHVRQDGLIGFAFEGRRAIADGPFGPVDPEPPPMSREEFAGLLLRWITEAAMACSTDGTVTLADNTMIDSRPSPFGNTAVRNKIDASVLIKKEVPTSDLRYDESSTFVFRPVTPGCTAVSNGDLHYTAEGKPETSYEINILPGGKYRMRFLLGSLDGEYKFVIKEVLCRPPERRSEELTDQSTELRFGVEEQNLLPPPEGQPSLLILRGSTTESNDVFRPAGVISGGEQKIIWDIVIQ